MNAPTLDADTFDYVDFDGASPDWWRAYRKRQPTQVIEPVLNKTQRDNLTAMIPNASLHKHVARVAISGEEGRTSLLTTTGQLIQEAPSRAATASQPATRGAVFSSRDIDAAGVALVMSIYERQGFNLTAEQIPFSKAWKPEETDRIRKLWAEVQQERAPGGNHTPAAVANITRRPAGRSSLAHI
jgi:hypothetical protein